MPPFLDEAVARRLRAYAEGGGLLVLGPAVPDRNTRFEPLRAFEETSAQFPGLVLKRLSQAQIEKYQRPSARLR